MRARGLKLVSRKYCIIYLPMSRPMRARGLKPHRGVRLPDRPLVAPHAGAWIETPNAGRAGRRATASRPMRARGLKQLLNYDSDWVD